MSKQVAKLRPIQILQIRAGPHSSWRLLTKWAGYADGELSGAQIRLLAARGRLVSWHNGHGFDGEHLAAEAEIACRATFLCIPGGQILQFDFEIAS